MRTEAVVKAELLELRKVIHEAAGTLTENDARAKGEQAKKLMAELSDILSEGAKPCPACSAKPHGNHKTEARFKEQSAGVLVQDVPDTYVVRCIGCDPVRTVEKEVVLGDGNKRVTTLVVFPSSKGETVAEAVTNWNNGVRTQTREITTVPV